MSTAPSHPYDDAVQAIQNAYDNQLRPIGFDDWITAKGGIRALILAHHLGQIIVPGDKGADGLDSQNRTYEYKVSSTDQYAFHFGARRRTADNDATIDRHFDGHYGAICAELKDSRVTRYVFIPSSSITADLKAHFRTCKGGQLNNVHSFDRLAALPGASVNSIP